MANNAIKSEPHKLALATEQSIYLFDGLSMMGEPFAEKVGSVVNRGAADIKLAKDVFDVLPLIDELYSIYEKRKQQRMSMGGRKAQYAAIHIVINDFQWIEPIVLMLNNKSVDDFVVTANTPEPSFSESGDDLFGFINKPHKNDLGGVMDSFLADLSPAKTTTSSNVSYHKKLMTLSVDNFDLYCLLQGISSKEKVKLLNPEKSIIEKSEFQHKYNMFLNFTRLKNDCDCNEDTNVYFPIQKWFELLVEKRKIRINASLLWKNMKPSLDILLEKSIKIAKQYYESIKLKDTSFVEWMLDSGYRELLLEYPVLLDQISNILVEFIDLIEECVQKLELHKEDIYRKFGINVDDTITDIKCDVSDRHFCGKCVVIVSFQSKKIVYKPRNMSVDFFWMKVANWISDIDNQIEVRAANVLVGNDYGFVEWIEADLNLCKEEIEKYIYRCGNLLGVVLDDQLIDIQIRYLLDVINVHNVQKKNSYNWQISYFDIKRKWMSINNKSSLFEYCNNLLASIQSAVSNCTLNEELELYFAPVKDSRTGRYSMDIMKDALYSGRYGVQIFLEMYYHFYGFEQRKKALENRVLKMANDFYLNTNEMKWFNLSFTNGVVSLLMELRNFALISNRNSFVEMIFKIIKSIPEKNITRSEESDYYNGIAGLLYIICDCYKKFNVDIDLYARNLIEYIVTDLFKRCDICGLWFQEEFYHQPLTGLAHGQSGYALALSKALPYINEGMRLKVTSQIQKCMDYEYNCYDNSEMNLPDYRKLLLKKGGDKSQKKFMYGYCSGILGTALVVSELSEELISFQKKEIWKMNAVQYLKKDILIGNDSLCCGTAGWIDYLASCHKNEEWSDELFKKIIFSINEQGYVFNGLEGVNEISLFKGMSGIGYSVLRYMGKYPSVLL